MNLKWISGALAIAALLVACGSDKGSDAKDEGDSSALPNSSGSLSSGGTSNGGTSNGGTSNGGTSNGGVSGTSSTNPNSSGSGTSSPSFAGTLTIVNKGYLQITGTMNVSPAFTAAPTASGSVHVQGKSGAATDVSITFGTSWSYYISQGGSAVVVPLNGSNSLDARLVIGDKACPGVFVGVVSLTDGVTTITDSLSFDNTAGLYGDYTASCP